jgi:hypothetical protein
MNRETGMRGATHDSPPAHFDPAGAERRQERRMTMNDRTLTGLGGLAAVLATLFLAGPGHARACPDTMMNGQVRHLSAETLARAPLRLAIPAGGDIDLNGCREVPGQGYVTMQPDLTLRLTENPNRRRIDFRVESACDAVMLVNSPSGQWRWSDDENPESPLDPALSYGRADTGWWDVWLGRYDRPDACRAQLIVSAGPPASQPTAARAQTRGYRTSDYRK